MWLMLGVGSIVFTTLNLIWSFQNKNAEWLRFAGLSLTVLTVCSCYSDEASRVVREDWAGLMDIMPAMSKALWVCVGASIILNSIPLFREEISKRKTPYN